MRFIHEERGCGDDDDGIAFQSVARFGVFQSAEEERAQQQEQKQQAEAVTLTPAHEPGDRRSDVGQIQQAEHYAHGEPYAIVIELPPARVGRQEFGSRTKPHIGDAQSREPNVVTQGFRVNARRGQRGETRVEFRGNIVILVVIGEKLCGFLALLL